MSKPDKNQTCSHDLPASQMDPALQAARDKKNQGGDDRFVRLLGLHSVTSGYG